MGRGLCVLGLVCLAVALAAEGTAGYSAPLATIAPEVLADTANEQTGDFLVVLKMQADTRAYARTTDREAQGRAVFSALKGAADASQAPVRAQLDSLGANYRVYWITNVIAVEGGRAVVDAMAARPDVATIESNRSFHVPLEQPEVASRAATAIEWNIKWVNAPAVWRLGYTGQGRVYANADTGVQWDHPALKTQYRGWNGTTADHNYNWWDAIKTPIVSGNSCGYNSPVPCDDYGHGTHTMGTAVGDDGASKQIGVSPGSKWIACRNMDNGVGRPSTYIECMQFFLAPTDLNGNNPDPSKRPDSVGNSYGCPPDELCTDYHVMQQAMENLRAAGVFMSVSAGNSGPSCSSIDDPPALEPSAFTVGASDSTDAIVSFSSRGPVTVDGSGLRKPELVAPGVGIRSSYIGDLYVSMQGTSMASPHVGGAVTLLWSAFPKFARNVDITEYVLERTAVHATDDLSCGGNAGGQNNVYGYGRLDILAAYNYMASNPLPFKLPLPFVLER